jgi:CheY-like chemotaxis protein
MQTSKSILLVDDDHQVRASISRMLIAQDYRVLEASDGDNALKMWHTHRDEIGLLMTDIMMPGMNGVDLANRLVGQARLMALYISGFPEMLDTQDQAVHSIPFLAKPFTSEQVSKTLRTLLNQPLRGWKCPKCAGGNYRGLTADSNGQTLTLTYMCAECGLKRFSEAELLKNLEECPFCSGPLVPGGYSYVGDDGYHLGNSCFCCKASIRIYTPECAAIPW